jgi:peptidoglycan/LPS O-acetylase OafA/YrhL
MSATSESSRTEASGPVVPGPRQHPRFPALDAVRGLAFLLVLFAHIGNARNLPTQWMGQFGVWIFFVLSAFLLSYPFFAQPSTMGQAGALKAYFIKRFLRIFPPLALALVAFHFLRGWDWEIVLRNAACLQGKGILWTVFIETRYYLLLPFMVATVAFLWSRPIVLSAVLLVALSLHLIDAPFWENPKTWFAGAVRREFQGLHLFLQYLPVFVSGTLLARLYVAASSSDLWSARLRRIAPACTITGFIALAMLSPSALGMMRGVPVAQDIFYLWWLPMIPLICGLVFFPLFLVGSLQRFLAHPVCRYFGMISYSGYLCHMIFVERFAAISSDGLFTLVVAGASCLTASLAYLLVERPLGAVALSLTRR